MMLAHVNNPEEQLPHASYDQYMGNSSPYLGQPTQYAQHVGAAEKPSISFQQLQSKYSNKKPTKAQAMGIVPQNLMYSFEDIKDELISADQESYQVPEEIEEELPLRIRTIQYEDMLAQQKTQHLNNELKKYLDYQPKAAQQPYEYHFTDSAYQNLNTMMLQSDHQYIPERPSTQQESGVGYRSTTLNAELPTTQNHYDMVNQQTLNSFSNVYTQWQSSSKKVTGVTQGLQLGKQISTPNRTTGVSTEKQYTGGIALYDSKASKYDNHHQQSRAYHQIGISTSNQYKKTSSQSPWRHQVEEPQIVAITTPVKDKRQSYGAPSYQQPTSTGKASRPQTASYINQTYHVTPSKTTGSSTSALLNQHHQNMIRDAPTSTVYQQASVNTPNKVSRPKTSDQHHGGSIGRTNAASKLASQASASQTAGIGSYYNTAQKRRKAQESQQKTSQHNFQQYSGSHAISSPFSKQSPTMGGTQPSSVALHSQMAQQQQQIHGMYGTFSNNNERTASTATMGGSANINGSSGHIRY
ncbi:hypothetical protein FGO68_gene17719 [Halteria grandinella]|uniref:Uncharacterized protein n=1 Tax=Halteria grandinella TaxID=5974 RepID=A0A8J8SXA1_HALGN|nr:hypothetical protein FGO68_gene17719 [Halteria grandinella]